MRSPLLDFDCRPHEAMTPNPVHVTRDLCVYGPGMSRVTVITGGAGGMGLATAKIVGRDDIVVLCDVRQDRLDAAAAALNDLGITPTVVNCDVTDRDAVVRLFETATGLGTVAAVIHTAGVSPSMGDADYVMRTNALGTLNVNEVFYGDRRRGLRDRQRGVDGGPHAAGGVDPDSAVPDGAHGRKRLHERHARRRATSPVRKRAPVSPTR